MMAVDAETVRALALSLPETSAAAHFQRTAFRTKYRIFATLDASAGDVNLMFRPDLRDFYCEQDRLSFSPVPGGWGRNGAARCNLATVDEAILLSALQAAHSLAMQTSRRRPDRVRS